MYKCKSCGKEFPVVAWIEIATTTYPSYSPQTFNWQYPPQQSQQFFTVTNYQVTTTIKKPCCPYCQQLDLEEIPTVKRDEKVFDTRDFVVPRSEGRDYFVPQCRKCPKCGGTLEGPTISDKLENDGLYWCKSCDENYRPSFSFTGFVAVIKS